MWLGSSPFRPECVDSRTRINSPITPPSPSRGRAPLEGNSHVMRFRKPFRLLTAVSVIAWPAATANYVGLAIGHTLTPRAPAATLLLLLGVAITTTLCSVLLRLVPSAVAAWTMGYIEGREDGPAQASEGATLLRLVND